MGGRGGCFKRRSPLANQAALVEAASARLGSAERRVVPCAAQTSEQYRYVSHRPRPSPSPPPPQRPHNFPARASASAPAAAASCLSSRALPAPSPSLWLGGGEGRSNSGVSTFPRLPPEPAAPGARLPPPSPLGGRHQGQRPRGRAPSPLHPPAPATSGQMFPQLRRAASVRRRCSPAWDGLCVRRAVGDAGGCGAGKLRCRARPGVARARGLRRRLRINMAVAERPAALGVVGGGRGPAAPRSSPARRRRSRSRRRRVTWLARCGAPARGGKAGGLLRARARRPGRVVWRAGGAAAGPGAAERHGCTGAFVIPSAPRVGGAGRSGPRPGRGGAGWRPTSVRRRRWRGPGRFVRRGRRLRRPRADQPF